MADSPEKPVLSTGQRWYRSVYLQTEHWRQLRKRKLSQARSCYMCDSRAHLQVHHVSYERLFNEALTDLIVLCRGCHRLQHAALSEEQIIAQEKEIMRRAFERRAAKATIRMPKKKRKRARWKSERFRHYAYYCMRAVRGGFARECDRAFLRANQHEILRMPI